MLQHNKRLARRALCCSITYLAATLRAVAAVGTAAAAWGRGLGLRPGRRRGRPAVLGDAIGEVTFVPDPDWECQPPSDDQPWEVTGDPFDASF